MQASHFSDEKERLIGIPLATLLRAMSMIILVLQWPRCLCQVSTSGIHLAYNAEKVFDVLKEDFA